MELKISINFDFSQLNVGLAEALGDYVSEYSKASVESSKKNIDNGVSPTTLKKATLDLSLIHI